VTSPDLDERLRSAVFAHLDRLLAANPRGDLRSNDINTFTFDGRTMPLVVQPGIWKPAAIDAALTIRTTYTLPDRPPPYIDAIGDDGLIRYKYRGTDPNLSDNRALRTAMREGRPLVYFVGVDKGVYVPRYPAWIVAEDPLRQEFAVAVDEAQRSPSTEPLDESQRAYLRRLTNLRLHQPVFRARVLRAYSGTCAMCRLRHPELLDAAHILPDGHPRGDPVLPNGLALCKIHHAAYDQNILGVRPDLVVEVQPKVLVEIDGPMLRHGLQGMAGVALLVPNGRREQPDKERLDERYQEFRQAG